jgi:hypothetical protein
MTIWQILGKYYNPEHTQIIVIGKILYKHLPNGDWFISGEIE